ncbi:GNAT family N-acetyltransferase [Clostridium sp.]|uniref:GNAT family N-acetyltransferase n=1 Tax=Clostridium sp. TaxID=1506 RepID=UPI0029064069|nr:GNAT family N-acetyltransferase [Clostridium sp.]MDU5108317.1 GNAT family N-acetyltransferase [Clostridium sp.]
MNILLTSVGRRSYLVKYFKEALGENGEIHVSNSSYISPAFQYADKSVVTPLIYNDNYISFLKNYCIENNISAIISLFDIDLPILSLKKKEFEDIGTKVIVSDENVINICNDKWETYKFLINNNFKAPKTFLELDDAILAIRNREIEYPVIIKPRWGMGSISVYEAENEEELNVLYKKAIRSVMNTYLKYESLENIEKSILIQEKLKGQEYGLDVINNLNGEYQNTVVKKKFAMRSGETDCAEIIDNENMKMLGQEISCKLKHISNLDMDVFLYDDEPYILEMNARFGGGYPFSHMSGVNLPKAIVCWLGGKEADKLLLNEKKGYIAHKDINIVPITIKENEDTNETNKYNIRLINKYEELKNVVKKFDKLFNPNLSDRDFKVEDLIKKLDEKAMTYVVEDRDVVGFISFYANDDVKKVAYLTLLAVLPEYQNRRIGKLLLDIFIKIAKERKMEKLCLEVHNDNIKAKDFYGKNGFNFYQNASEKSIYMIREL